MSSALLKVKSNSMNLPYLACEQHVWQFEYFDLFNIYDTAFQQANSKICSALWFLVHRTLSMTLLDQQLFISLPGAGRTGGVC